MAMRIAGAIVPHRGPTPRRSELYGQFQDGSGFGTRAQVPMLPARAQELHGPWQAVAQQTPWAQWPLAQTSSPTQGGISVWRPQNPFLQMKGDAHSGSAVHDDAHRVPLVLHL